MGTMSAANVTTAAPEEGSGRNFSPGMVLSNLSNSIAADSFSALMGALLIRISTKNGMGDRSATSYTTLLSSFLRCTDQKQKTAEKLREWVLPLITCKETLADMGCGAGEISEQLLPHFNRAILLDLSKNNVHELKSRFLDKANVTILEEDLDLYTPDFNADLILFSFSIGYMGQKLPEQDRNAFRLEKLKEYYSRLNPGGKIVTVGAEHSGAYKDLFDYMDIPVHDELNRMLDMVSSIWPTERRIFAVTVTAESVSTMVHCLRLITYDDGTKYMDRVPRYTDFCKTLSRENGMLLFRYETVLTITGRPMVAQLQEMRSHFD